MRIRAEIVMLLACMCLYCSKGLNAQTKPDTIHTSLNGEEMAAIVKEAGFSPEVTKDSQGDPLIRFRLEALRCAIYFFGCKNDRCESYQFSAGFSMEKKPGQEKINEWNRTKRFGRAYIDAEQDPHIEMDVDLDGGVTHEYIVRTLSTWRAVFLAFVKYIG